MSSFGSKLMNSIVYLALRFPRFKVMPSPRLGTAFRKKVEMVGQGDLASTALIGIYGNA
jgi:hypothetical protein